MGSATWHSSTLVAGPYVLSGHRVLRRCEKYLLDAEGRALGLDALADVRDCQGARVDDVHDVRLRDDLSREQQRLQVVARGLRVVELRQRETGGSRVLAGDERDREPCGGRSLDLHVLEDRHALLSVDDVLQTFDARVLTGDGDVPGETLLLEDAD